MKTSRNAVRKFTFVDLFAGAGGFTEGFLLARTERSCFELVASSDIHPLACLSHRNRFGAQLEIDYDFLVGDIRQNGFVDQLLARIGRRSLEIDVIVGGPPCQGFSLFGKRNENDPRNDLFLPYLRVIEACKPKYFVMENVPGLALMYGGKTVERIHSEVERLRPVRYRVVGPITVNAADFGVPQLRERILFIGHRIDVPPLLKITPTHHGSRVTVQDALSDLAFLRAWESNGSYHVPPNTPYQRESRKGRLFQVLGLERRDHGLANHDAARHTPEVIARFAMIHPGKGYDSIPEPLWSQYLKTSKKWCVRLSPDQPAYTMTTLPDDFIHYEQHRILTVREVARLQSFDDTFEFLGPRATGGGGKGNKKRTQELPQYTQVGNAVPPLLARGIGLAVLNALA